ncbi:hypothetical protein TNCV_1346251 [Trichonephila clavipes]|nr:hypothetical protein TNCV_1346251 [Trichonephila clavipes]
MRFPCGKKVKISTEIVKGMHIASKRQEEIRFQLTRRAASPLVWLVEGEERWEAPGYSQGFLPLNWGGTEQKRTFNCMVLKAKANDRRKYSSP